MFWRSRQNPSFWTFMATVLQLLQRLRCACRPMLTRKPARLLRLGTFTFLEQEWRMWMNDPPRHPDAAFVGFCRKVVRAEEGMLHNR